MKKKKILISILVIVLIIAVFLIVHLFSLTDSVGTKDPRGTETPGASENSEIVFPVKASLVRKGNLISWLNTSGYAYPIQDYEIESKINGQVNELNCFDGKIVKKGDLLFKLDDEEYQIEATKTKNSLLKTQIEYDLQKMTSMEGEIHLTKYKHESDSLNEKYETAKKLYIDHKISSDDLNRVKRDYETMEAIINAKREDVIASMSGLTDAVANFDKAKLNLSYARFTSPIDGLIANCKISKGSFIKGSDICLRVIDISSIKMQSEVTEADIENIHVGDPVEAAFIAVPNKTFTGKVIEINPSIDLDKRTAKVTLLLANPGLLIKPGMFASVKIGSNTSPDVILIPHSALLIRDNKSLVFILKNGLAQWKYISLGKSNDQYYIVKEGLNIGDTLIIDGNFTLAHMSKVNITTIDKY